MSGWFVLLVLLAAINPARVRPHLTVRDRPAQALAAAALVVGAGALLAGLATDILDALEITDETWHIGAGAVGVLVGARVLIAPHIVGVELPDGWAAAVAPFAFPLLFTPQLASLMVLLGATESTTASIGRLAASLAITIGVGVVPYRRPGLWMAAARFGGGLLVVMSVALVVAGIRNV